MGQSDRIRARHAAVRMAAAALLATVACTTEKATETADEQAATTAVATTVAGTPATGEPLRVGFVNMESGAAALPEFTVGGKLAVERVNDFDEGINGRPIELVTCATDGTPESSAGCANKLVAEGVVAVIEAADLGTDAKAPILKDAGIPLIGTSTLGTSQSLNQDAFFFSPPATTYPTSEVDLAAAVGAEKLTMLLPDVSQVPIVSDLSTKQAALNGIEVEIVKFDPAAPDFDAALAAIGANGSDAIATIATDDWCTGIARAAKASGFTGKLILGTCSRFVKDLGVEETTGILRLSSTWGPISYQYAPPAAQEIIDQYTVAATAAKLSDEEATRSFGGYLVVLQAANALRSVTGEVTAATVMAALRSLSGLDNPLGETITCNPRPYPGFSGCTQGWLMLSQEPDGTSKPIGDGGFVKPKS